MNGLCNFRKEGDAKARAMAHPPPLRTAVIVVSCLALALLIASVVWLLIRVGALTTHLDTVAAVATAASAFDSTSKLTSKQQLANELAPYLSTLGNLTVESLTVKGKSALEGGATVAKSLTASASVDFGDAEVVAYGVVGPYSQGQNSGPRDPVVFASGVTTPGGKPFFKGDMPVYGTVQTNQNSWTAWQHAMQADE